MNAILARVLRFVFVLGTLCSLLPLNAGAAWWEFGRSDGEPSISSLRFNNVDAEQRDDLLVLTRDDLVGGLVNVRGKAEVRRGDIGLVEISLDSGKNWASATLGERGLFSYEFRPQLDREYTFQIRAISTTGTSTGPEEHDFKLLVTSADGGREARAVFQKLLDAYQREDRASFMQYVSDQFEGNFGALEDGLSKDFRFLDDIRIQTQIARINRQERIYEIYFTYNRQVRSTKTGALLKDSAASVVGLRLEAGGMKLMRLSAPLIFGVSEAEDVATSVTGQSVGQQVLTIDASGNVAQASQGQTASASGSGSGTKVLAARGFNSFDSFDFDTDSTVAETGIPPVDGDIAWNGEPAMLWLRNGVAFKAISCPISSVQTLPTSGFSVGAQQIVGIAAGRCYALKLFSGKYAVIEMVSIVTSGGIGTGTLTFRYKYQPNGSPNF